jgi:hypothetical protein
MTAPRVRRSYRVSDLRGFSWPLAEKIAAEADVNARLVVSVARELAGVGPPVRGRTAERARVALLARGLPAAGSRS